MVATRIGPSFGVIARPPPPTTSAAPPGRPPERAPSRAPPCSAPGAARPRSGDARRPPRTGRAHRRGRRGRAARARRAGGRGDDRLHVRHDRAAEGLRGHPRRPAGHGLDVRPRAGPARQPDGDTCSCRSRTRWPASRSTRRSRRAARSRSGAAIRHASSTGSPRSARRTSRRCRGSRRRSMPPCSTASPSTRGSSTGVALGFLAAIADVWRAPSPGAVTGRCASRSRRSRWKASSSPRTVATARWVPCSSAALRARAPSVPLLGAVAAVGIRAGRARAYPAAAAPGDASMSSSSDAFTPRGRTITGHCASAVRRRDTPPSSTARTGP